jgi:hypothetical protein
MFPEERFEPNFAEIFGIGGPFGSPSRMRELIEQIEGSDCGNPNCPVHGRGRKAQPKGWIAATDKIRRDGALGIKVNTSEGSKTKVGPPIHPESPFKVTKTATAIKLCKNLFK